MNKYTVALKYLKKPFSVLLAALAICTASGFGASAAGVSESPYCGYYYDQWDEARPAPNSYRPTDCRTAAEIGISGIGTVNDMASDSSGKIYIMDSDNSIIYRLASNMSLVDKITVSDGGGEINFAGANGLTVDESGEKLKLYIADTDNHRILVTDENGKLLRIIGKPDTDMLSESQVFSPIKLAVSVDGSVFALCRQMYEGAILMNDKGEFLGFFGSNQVEVNASVLSDYFWKKILGEKLGSKFASYVPREYTNLAIDEKGFVYTTTLVTAESSTQIRRLNWKSSNVLPSEFFGDANNSYGTNKFIDIAAMGDGLFAALDSNNGRIFIYGNDGEGVTVFGGSGIQSGTFRTAVAIECVGNSVYVYDQSTRQITKFMPTEYGATLLKASRMFLKGSYKDSDSLWRVILRQNNGYEKAYISIGRNLMEQGNFKEAMSYFKKGGAAKDYSEAKEKVRSEHMRRYFGIYALIFVAVFTLFLFLLRDKGSYKSDEKSDPVTLSGKMRYALFHPSKGISALACGNVKMNIASVVIVLAAFLMSVLSYQFTGFIFNKNEPGKMDIISIFITVAGMFCVAAVSNWLVITMADGKGKFNEIVNVMAFSLVPVLASQAVNIVLSNILVSGEGMFISVVSIIGWGWGAVILMAGLCKIHAFSFGRNIIMSALTVVAALIVLILVLLSFSIATQIQMFFESVMGELKMIF